MKNLEKAYKIIFNESPENLKEWEMSEKIINNFDVPKLGEELSKEIIFEIVNHVKFPNQEKTTEIVGRAEGFASELFLELRNEPHMAEIEFLEHKNKLK